LVFDVYEDSSTGFLRARRMEEFGGGDGLADVALGVVGDVNEETTEGGGQGSGAD
jgi:hypothetical protein